MSRPADRRATAADGLVRIEVDPAGALTGVEFSQVTPVADSWSQRPASRS